MRKCLHPAKSVYALIVFAACAGSLPAGAFGRPPTPAAFSANAAPPESSAISASAGPPAAPASFLRAEDHRFAAIAYRIALAGAAYCPERFPLTGLLFHHLPEYGRTDRPQMAAAYGLDRGPGVLAVVADSAAAQSGLVAGDVLLGVNSRPFLSGAKIAEQADRALWRRDVEVSEALLEQELARGSVSLTVLRGGRTFKTRLGATPACPARIRLARSPQVNGFVSGRYVIMTTGLLGFTQDEDELAIVLAHELAHLILRHPERLAAQKVPRGAKRATSRNAPLIRATEEEADRLGLKLAWLAGYDVSAAIPFWRRFYAKYDRGGIPLYRTHPSLRARERLIKETLAGLGSSNAGAQRPELGKGALGES